MGVFWCLYTWLFVVSFVKIQNHGRAAQAILSALGVWLVLALRSPYCGVDLMGTKGEGYLGTFGRITLTNWSDLAFIYFEPGWTVYCKLCSYVSTDPQMFLAITGTITIGLISWMIYKYASNILLAFVVYVSFGLYLFSFSGIRQALALSITFFAAHFIMGQKRLLVFVGLVVLASTIHASAIIFLMAWLVSRVRLTKLRGIFLLVVLFLLLPVLSSIVQFLAPIIFGRDYLGYENEGGAVTMFLVYTVIFLLSLTINVSNPLLRWMLLLAVASQSLGTISTGAMTRIGYYFSIFFVLFVPEYLGHFKEKNVRLVLEGLVCILFMIYFYLTSSGGYLNVVPYHFYWEPGQSM